MSYKWNEKDGLVDGKTGAQIMQLSLTNCTRKFRRIAGKNLVNILNNMERSKKLQMPMDPSLVTMGPTGKQANE